MAPQKRTNRYKIKCLECNREMDMDYKNRHNVKFHKAIIAQHRTIRYEVVSAPKNPFEAAASKKKENKLVPDSQTKDDSYEIQEQLLTSDDIPGPSDNKKIILNEEETEHASKNCET